LFHDLWQDVRFGLRMLGKQPSFAIVAVITLGLAIGSNTAIFSAVHAALLESLPFPEPGQLVFANGVDPRADRRGQQTWISYNDFEDWREQSQLFSAMSACVSQSVNLTGREEPRRVVGAFVSANFFHMLGRGPSVGRDFRQGEDRPGSENVVIVSYAAWKDVFGADPDLAGKTLTLNNNMFAVVGILPENFRSWWQADVWIPYHHWPNYAPNRAGLTVGPIGRLKSGVTLAQAQAEADTIAARLAQQYPDTNHNRRFAIRSLHEVTIEDVRPILLALMGAVLFVLLIACANVGSLLLARAAAREKEMATRVALGAGRVRLVRQVLTETLLLWLAGGALALVLGRWSIDAILSIAPGDLPNGAVPTLNATVLVFTFGLSLLTGLLFGLIPALRSARPDLNESLKESGRSASAGSGRSRLRAALVVTQMALTLMLLIGSGLLLRSFLSASGVDPGFDPHNLLTLQYRIPRNRYPDGAQQMEFHRRVVERVSQIPGVISAGTVRAMPFAGNRSSAVFTLPDRPEPPAGEVWRVQTNFADPNYLRTMRIPLRRGRGITEQDGPDSPPVALINESMARRYWPENDPIGRGMRIELRPKEFVTATIVGIVGDVKHGRMEEPQAVQVYVPMAQQPFIFTELAVRTKGDPLALAPAVRSAIWSVDKDQPVWGLRSMESQIERALGPKRFLATLVGVYALLALLLAAIGIYSVMATSVAQRTHEIGIRMALGAERTDILAMVVWQGMLLTALGTGIGVTAALGLTRFIETLLFGVRPTDAVTFACVIALLAGVALLACLLPARRATRVDPLVALRYE
jgi:putative ABC transport system permease protein